ncbi:MAG: hypothetical protein JXB04_02495, partial [Kiritimatiellae bacterium]|nr:hypothetical protein [Kiritimatiellia bacterium]
MKPVWLVVLSVFVVSLSAPAETPAIDIPRLDGITIDGKADDWGDRGYRVEMMTEEDGRFLPADDCDAAFRLGWDKRGLLMIFFVKDDVYTEYPNEAELWKMDSIEIFVTRGPGEPDLAQVIYGPGLDEKFPELRRYFYDHRHTKELTEKIKAISFDGARTRVDGGYVLEVRMPWRNLDLSPRVGLPLGVQIYVNDADNAEKDLSVKWYPRGGTHADTTAMHLVRLAEKPSPPALAAVTGYWRFFREPRVKVAAPARLLGKNVEVLAAGETVARGTLAAEGGRAAAEIALPVPAAEEQYPALDVLIGGERAASCNLPDAGKERARALIDEEFRCEPFVFSEPRLPAADFTEPMRGEALLGPYDVRATFYDSDYNQVTAAD